MTDQGLLGIGFHVWGMICLGVALMYSFVWPKPGLRTPPRAGFRHWMLRWSHALVWVLMSAGCFLTSAGQFKTGKIFGWLALALYTSFMTCYLLELIAIRRASRLEQSMT